MESRNNIQIIPEFVAGIACVLQICLELADSSLKRLVFNVRGETPISPGHLCGSEFHLPCTPGFPRLIPAFCFRMHEHHQLSFPGRRETELNLYRVA